MIYKIIPTREFADDFKKLDKFMQDRIKKKVEEVSQDPIRYKHMHYDFSGSCRLWIGKLRIVFSYYIPKRELYLSINLT